jgi:hypothetical protein
LWLVAAVVAAKIVAVVVVLAQSLLQVDIPRKH